MGGGKIEAMLFHAAPHFGERNLPSGTIELVVNLREDELRIYDPDRPDRCRRFSGALVSGAYGRGFVTRPGSPLGNRQANGCASGCAQRLGGTDSFREEGTWEASVFATS